LAPASCEAGAFRWGLAKRQFMKFWITSLCKGLRAIVWDRFFALAAIAAAASGALLYELKGADAVYAALEDDIPVFTLLVLFLPAVLMLAAIIEVMLPKGLVERWLGAGSGFRGIMVATFAGAFTPGGPFVSFPLVLALYRAGAAWAPLVTYITSWSILSMVRTLVFEVPLVGVELPMVRYLACILLPPVAGVTAQFITRFYRPPEEGIGRK
jgi:uncharacterized membrane protein YraQ (UPF0718 family)